MKDACLHLRATFAVAVLLSSLVPGIHAFVPLVQTHTVAKWTMPSTGVVTSPATALYMANNNLFDRFSRVAKSNLNNILKNLEDPEKIMSQALEDMQVGHEVVRLYLVCWLSSNLFCESRMIWSKSDNRTPK